MSRCCDICGRGAQTAVSRSHSNVSIKRRQYVNLQTKNIFGQDNSSKSFLGKDNRIIKRYLAKKASPSGKISVGNNGKVKVKICAKCLKVLKRGLKKS